MKRYGGKIWKRLWEVVFGRTARCEFEETVQKTVLDFWKRDITNKLSLLKFDKDCKQIVKTFFRGELFGPLKKSLQKIEKLLILLQNKTHEKIWSKNLEKIVGSSFWKDSLM